MKLKNTPRIKLFSIFNGLPESLLDGSSKLCVFYEKAEGEPQPWRAKVCVMLTSCKRHKDATLQVCMEAKADELDELVEGVAAEIKKWSVEVRFVKQDIPCHGGEAADLVREVLEDKVRQEN